ncbi:MAG: site-specific DNA-methyltransferase [Bifidobacteriaceae bacterium]|jgi:adenine-specific DNA-methyltransferase|nr:site-specific DNA-methyltransferase [Bifidobacteriaceae bacterium]
MDKNEIHIGDNLDFFKENAVRLHNKVDFIYIDPPYNTQNLFCYNDKKTLDEWIIFMGGRLNYAKKLLNNEGVIFISIDDNSLYELKLLCDKIFEKQNYIGTMITKQSERSNSIHINTTHEYILCYAKNKTFLPKFETLRIKNPADKVMIESLYDIVKKELPEGKEYAKKILRKEIIKYCKLKEITWLKNYHNITDKGEIFFAKDLSVPGIPNRINLPDLNKKLEPLLTRRWSNQFTIMKLHNQNRLYWNNNRPWKIQYLREAKDSAPSILNYYSRMGSNDLKKLGLYGLFDTPKPVELIKYLIRLSVKKKNAVILDFFAGSGSTAQAVYEINKSDKKNHKYILVQLNEIMNFETPCYKTARKLKIMPTVDQAMIFRIKTYLSKNKISDNILINKLVPKQKVLEYA